MSSNEQPLTKIKIAVISSLTTFLATGLLIPGILWVGGAFGRKVANTQLATIANDIAADEGFQDVMQQKITAEHSKLLAEMKQEVKTTQDEIARTLKNLGFVVETNNNATTVTISGVVECNGLRVSGISEGQERSTVVDAGSINLTWGSHLRTGQHRPSNHRQSGTRPATLGRGSGGTGRLVQRQGNRHVHGPTRLESTRGRHPHRQGVGCRRVAARSVGTYRIWSHHAVRRVAATEGQSGVTQGRVGPVHSCGSSDGKRPRIRSPVRDRGTG